MKTAIKRIPEIDIIKGLGIIFMVGGHCDFPINSFTSLFRMALFIIASGYCYNEKYSGSFDGLRLFLVRKIKSLWFPYFVWTCIFSLLYNFFIYIGIYTDNPLFLDECDWGHNQLFSYWSWKHIINNTASGFIFQGYTTQMGGAFWFLNTLFFLSITYCAIDFVIRKAFSEKIHDIAQVLISVLFLSAGYYCSSHSIKLYGYERVLSYYILFSGGIFCKKNPIPDKIPNCILLSVSCGLLLLLKKYGHIGLVNNEYTNPLFFIAVSFCGWTFIHSLAHLLRKEIHIQSFFVFIGQNTLPIVILHFLSFKIINLVGIYILGKSHYLLAAFPTLFNDGIWWMAYLCTGVAIPIGCNEIWKKLKTKLVPKIRCSTIRWFLE